MKQATSILILAGIIVALGGCNRQAETNDSANAADIGETAKPAAAVKSDKYDGTVGKVGAPFRLSYRVVGTPIVGSPLIIDLKVASTMGPRPVTLSYAMRDPAAILFAESQPRSVRLSPADNEVDLEQQLSIVPQRDGRLYVNVTATIDDGDNSSSTTMAIPIQVGVGSRDMEENGELGVDEDGEAIRILE